MKNESRFDIESRAYSGLQELLAKAREVRLNFEMASLPLPAPLARLLGEMPGDGIGNEDGPRLTIPPLQSPAKPPEATSEWIWVRCEDLLVQTLVLGILRESGSPMKPKDILEKVISINANINSNSVYNIGPRLDGTLIKREGGLWELMNESKAPVLYQGNAWGNVDIFGKQDLAAHRRYVILHILRMASDGLMQMQIVRQLAASRLSKAPIEKTLVKMDIQQLEASGSIKRIGRTKKWTTNEKAQ